MFKRLYINISSFDLQALKTISWVERGVEMLRIALQYLNISLKRIMLLNAGFKHEDNFFGVMNDEKCFDYDIIAVVLNHQNL